MRQSNSDVPHNPTWLSQQEHEKYSSFRIEKRRQDWVLGRWTMKKLAAHFLHISFPDFLRIEIFAAGDGAPELYFDAQPVRQTISLSHREHFAIAALTDSDMKMGCDLEFVEPRSKVFMSDYFTTNENVLVQKFNNSALYANFIWTAKEATVKALREGLRLDTRAVEVVELKKDTEQFTFKMQYHKTDTPYWGQAVLFDGFIAAFVCERSQFKMIRIN
ncbi:MAG: 4'-phosphopantetheinyl transferase superfamily protein [Deferribacteres bacterium]|nr:4'-phosphopantetheinyl transferase superfamily protein [candidate division KSB1 bacterium]MCB9502737.1 4'-phosphopantetheinyl transferase superfamily protein [Deferribacteres bacterium]